MRIVHTALRYPPATGGVETYVEQIVERTRHVADPNNQHPKDLRDVRVLTSRLRTHGPIEELTPEHLLDDPPYVQRLHHSQTPIFSYPRLQSLRYYLGHHQPDIIHAYSYWYQPADIAARYAQKHAIPFIFHPIYYTNDIRRKPAWQLYQKTIGRRTFAAADVVAVISPFEQKLIEQAGLPVKRFELLPPGIDPQEFNNAPSNPFPTWNIKSKNILLTVSRLAPGKGLDDVLTALPAILRRHPDTTLAIVGEDFGALAALQAQLNQLGLDQHVRFLDKLSRPDLIAAYHHATILLHPSHYEAFGIVLAESLAAGTPVIARNATAIPFVAPHQQAGLLFNNQQDLIDHTNELLTNPQLRQNLAQQGHSHILNNFTWDTTIQKLLALYHELL